jgi:hypothetical protein
MNRHSLKHILFWVLAGAAFGIFFGAVSSIFQDGPSVWVGIQQSWWWFAIAGAIKALTDFRLPSWGQTTSEK